MPNTEACAFLSGTDDEVIRVNFHSVYNTGMWDWFLIIGFVISLLAAVFLPRVFYWANPAPVIVFVVAFGIFLSVFFWGKSRRLP
jgi:hypothetical protein